MINTATAYHNSWPLSIVFWHRFLVLSAVEARALRHPKRPCQESAVVIYLAEHSGLPWAQAGSMIRWFLAHRCLIRHKN